MNTPTRRYRPIMEVGQGGMGWVFLAVTQGPGGFSKLHVVKRLKPSLADEPEFLHMFLDEARLSARIDHPNVVHTIEVGFDGKYHFIAMEYLDGQPLDAIARRDSDAGKRIPLGLHVRILAQALAGLHFAHELRDYDGAALNVVHRDVSPHNVMVTYEGAVKVLDFGIAKAADSTQRTRSGILRGKCAYMAPEQIAATLPLDRRADIFAVGVMLWQAVSGRAIWGDLSEGEIARRLGRGDIPSLEAACPTAPRELVAICEKALAVDRDARYPTAAAFQLALEGYLESKRELTSPREMGA